jgi:uncharacterized membrane protein YbhN (UPF0104 family)
MEKVKTCLKELLRAICGGAVLSAGLSILLLLSGLVFKGFRLSEALEILRSGLFIASGLVLFVVAGMFLFPKGGRKIEEQPAWKKNFQVLKLSGASMAAALVLLSWALIVDYILFYY